MLLHEKYGVVPSIYKLLGEGGSGCHLWLSSLSPRGVSSQVSLNKSKVRLNAAPKSSSWFSTSCLSWAGDVRMTFNPGLFRMSCHPFFHECAWTSKSIRSVTIIHGAATRKVLEKVGFHLFSSCRGSSTACLFPSWTYCPHQSSSVWLSDLSCSTCSVTFTRSFSVWLFKHRLKHFSFLCQVPNLTFADLIRVTNHGIEKVMTNFCEQLAQCSILN